MVSRITGNTCSHPFPFPYTLSRHWTAEGTKVQQHNVQKKPRNKKRRQKQSRTRSKQTDKKNERIQSVAFKLFPSPVPCVTLGPKNLPFWEAPCFDHVWFCPFLSRERAPSALVAAPRLTVGHINSPARPLPVHTAAATSRTPPR